MRHRCNCRHSFKNSSAMNLPRTTQHGSVIVVRWENSRLQWPSRSHFHLCVRGVDLVLVHCYAVNNSAPAWGWGVSHGVPPRLSGCISRRSHSHIGKEHHLGEAKKGQCPPSPWSFGQRRPSPLQPTHMMVLVLHVDDLMLVKFQTLIFK